MSPVRVLIVDDSAVMRHLIARALRMDPMLEVVGAVADPIEAREAIKRLSPDVITLDVEMPRMSGLDFLERLMRLRPMPVVMVSTLTHAGADAAVEALALGAVDCVGKPVEQIDGQPFLDLAATVRAAAGARVSSSAQKPAASAEAPPTGPRFQSNGYVLGVGASTGGVEALLTFVSGLPESCPPTVITQHMPATFTKSFAQRLDRACRAHVQEAYDGAPLRPGHIYVAPGGERHLRVHRAGGLVCRLEESAPVSGHRPSVDVLFQSIAETAGAASVGVILTGMGRDGAQGLLAIRQAGGRTFGQDEASCVVYGMPKAAFEIGAVERQAPIDRMSAAVLGVCGRGARAA